MDLLIFGALVRPPSTAWVELLFFRHSGLAGGFLGRFAVAQRFIANCIV